MIKRFQRLCQVQSELDILFVKLTAQIEDCIRTTLSGNVNYASGVGDFTQSLSS